MIPGLTACAPAHRLPKHAFIHNACILRRECLSGAPVFELDFKEVHAYKREVMSGVPAVPLAALTSIAVDLSLPSWKDALNAAGFIAASPSIWLVEGLLSYLTLTEATTLMSTIHRIAAHGSVACVTFPGTKYEIAGPGSGQSSMHPFLCDHGGAFLESCGWLNTQQQQLGDIAAKLGRPTIPRDFGYFIVTASVVKQTRSKM